MEYDVDLSTCLGSLQLESPVMTASGTCGFGRELADFYELKELGGLIVKGITVDPRDGNPTPRIAETAAGLINSIGLENPGLAGFIEEELPFIKNVTSKVLINISGHSLDDFKRLAAGLAENEGFDGIEVNVSCPNIKGGGLAFGTDPELVYQITRLVRKEYTGFVMVKLTPNVSNIIPIANSAAEGGADALAVANTLPGMKIDIDRQKPVLATGSGGLSGPAIKPVALRLVYEIVKNDILPVLGVGGIMSAEDAIEYFLAGAKAVGVGTATLIDPYAPIKIKSGIREYLNNNNFDSLNEIIGLAHKKGENNDRSKRSN
ncbi:MAG: dihydroorotate dehydrogenase [Bacillota bacterium]